MCLMYFARFCASLVTLSNATLRSASLGVIRDRGVGGGQGGHLPPNIFKIIKR